MPRQFAIPARVKSFFDYYELSADTSEILAAFGYERETRSLSLARRMGDFGWAESLRKDMMTVIPNISLTNETAQREFLVAPVLFRLSALFGIKVFPEYNVNVSANLKGNLDYLVRGKSNLVIIEAKQGDLYRDFRQLAAEMVAVDQWTDATTEHLFGAVTVGNVWQFAMLNRQTKMLAQDLSLFRIPEDLEDLARVLVAILDGEVSAE